jgi:hypothetical protein
MAQTMHAHYSRHAVICLQRGNGPRHLSAAHAMLQYRRRISSSSNNQLSTTSDLRPRTTSTAEAQGPLSAESLRRLSTANLVRGVVLGYVFSRPYLLKPAFAILKRIANSETQMLNPDANLVLRMVLRPLFYNHFCAGTNGAEIQATKAQIKRIGYSGIILCYGKEVQVSRSDELRSATDNVEELDQDIRKWRDGNLQTLDMIGEGDWLGIKLVASTYRVQQNKRYVLTDLQVDRCRLENNCSTYAGRKTSCGLCGLDRYDLS